MSSFSKIYNKIFDSSLRKGKHVKMVDMLNHRMDIKYMIPITTKHIYNDLPIGLAKRVVDLNNLPFGLSKNHSIHKVRELYLSSFEELVTINEPKTQDEIIQFKNMIQNIYTRHSSIISTISKGLNELQHENKITDLEEPQMQLFLNNFYTNRCEIRIVLEHYLSFFEKPRGDKYYGIINFESNIENIIQDSINDIQSICDTNSIPLHLDDIIEIKNTNTNLILPTIEHYLYYVLFEIIKNSVEAIKHRPNPYISIAISEIDINWIVIHICDNGTGINPNIMEKIWYYSFTTHPLNVNRIIEQTDFATKSPLSGFGYGLPISDIYMNFLNSSANNIKIFSNNHGTNVYIQLRRHLM